MTSQAQSGAGEHAADAPAGGLSVIVIARNEERNIERCLRSVAAQPIPPGGREIIVVDSDSADATAARARELADALYRVSGRGLCAALGRRVGAERASHDVLLFLDADMELEPDWTERGLKHLTGHDETAGVVGIRDDHCYDAGRPAGVRENVYGVKQPREAPRFGGALMIRRRALEAVGGFDARLISTEESELHGRLKAAGLRIDEIPVPMIRHHTPLVPMPKKVLDLLLAPRFTGLGLSLRYSVAKGTVLHHLRRLGDFYAYILTDLAALIALALAAWLEGAWMATAALEAAAFAVAAARGETKRFAQSKFLLPPFIKGLFMRRELDYTVERIVK